MSVISNGFEPNSNNISDESIIAFVRLLLANEAQVLSNGNHFFVSAPGWTYCSWPYLTGDGKLFAGYLARGWRTGTLLENCCECSSQVCLLGFAGSPLSDNNSFWGVCLECSSIRRGRSSAGLFCERMKFVMELRRRFPFVLKGHDCLYCPLTYENFVDEMQGAVLRQGPRVNVLDLSVVARYKF